MERSLNTLLSSNSFGNVTQSTISTAGIKNGHSRLRSLSSWLFHMLINHGCSLYSANVHCLPSNIHVEPVPNDDDIA